MAAKHFYRQGFLLLLFNFISTAALEKRFSDLKRCADSECSMLLCRGKAVKDFSGPDCRFLQVKKSETIYVYYKLAGRRSDLWAGSVGSTFGYFPKDLLAVNHHYTEEELEVPAEETDFVCFDTGFDKFNNYDVGLLLGLSVEESDSENKGTTDQIQVAKDTEKETQPSEGGTDSEKQTEHQDNSKDIVEVPDDQNALLTDLDVTELPSVEEAKSDTAPAPVVIDSVEEVEQNTRVEPVLENFVSEKIETKDSPTTFEVDSVPKDELTSKTESVSISEGVQIAEQKTTYGTTFDAVISDEEITKKVTPYDVEESEDVGKPPENNDITEDTPLLSFTEDAVNSPTSDPINRHEAPPVTRDDKQHTEEEKNAWTSFGDTVFSVVTGGERTEREVSSEEEDDDKEEEPATKSPQNLEEAKNEFEEPLKTPENESVSISEGVQIPELKTTLGTTFDAVISDNEITKKVTPYDVEESEDVVNHHEDNDVVKDTPLLSFTKDAVNSPTSDSINQHEAPPVVRDDKQHTAEDKNAWTSFGDAVFSVVTGGERTERDVSSEEEDDEEEEPATKSHQNFEEAKNELDESLKTAENESVSISEGVQIPELKTTFGTTFDAVISDDEITKKFTPHDVEESEDDEKNPGDSVVIKDTPLLSFTEDAVNSPTSDHLSQHEAPALIHDDKSQTAEEKNAWTSFGDAIFSVVTGGERTEGEVSSEEEDDEEESLAETPQIYEEAKNELVEPLTAESPKEPVVQEPSESSSVKTDNSETDTGSVNPLFDRDNQSDGVIRPEEARIKSFEPTGETISQINHQTEASTKSKAQVLQKDTSASNKAEKSDFETTAEPIDHKEEESSSSISMEHRQDLDSMSDEKKTVTEQVFVSTKTESHQDLSTVEKQSRILDVQNNKKTKDDIVPDQKHQRIMPDLEKNKNIQDLSDKGPEVHEQSHTEKMEREKDAVLEEENIEEKEEEELLEDENALSQSDYTDSASTLQPEYTDSVMRLTVLRDHFTVEGMERIQRLLGLKNLYKLEAMFSDLDVELQATLLSHADTVQEIENALEGILEVSENTILDEIEKMLDSRNAKQGHDQHMDKSSLDEETQILDDFQELAYSLRQKYSTASDSTSLAPEKDSDIDPDELALNVKEEIAHTVEEDKVDSVPETESEDNVTITDHEERPAVTEEDHMVLSEVHSGPDVSVGEDGGHFNKNEDNLPGFSQPDEIQKVPQATLENPLDMGLGVEVEQSPTGSLNPLEQVSEIHEVDVGLFSTGVVYMGCMLSTIRSKLVEWTTVMISLLPEEWKPGDTLYGCPWQVVVTTAFVGVLTFTLFFWRTVLAVKRRQYLVDEKRLTEQIQALKKEKNDALTRMSELQKQTEQLKESHKQSKETVSCTMKKLQDVESKVLKAQSLNEQIAEEKNTYAKLLEEEQTNSKEYETRIEKLEKTNEKLQLSRKKIQEALAKTTILLDEAKIREDARNVQHKCLDKEYAALKEENKTLKTNIKSWEDKHKQLSEQIKSYQKSQKELEDSVVLKDHNVEVLSDLLADLDTRDLQKGDSKFLANGEMAPDKKTFVKNRIKQMMDVSRVQTTLTVVEEERDRFMTKLLNEEKTRKTLEEKHQDLEHAIATLKSEKSHVENQFKILQQKNEIMVEMYQQKENALQQKLTKEELERRSKENLLSEVGGKAVEAEEQVKVLRQRINEMEEQMKKTEEVYKDQIKEQENKTHSNWVNARNAERALNQEKLESSKLREKLTVLTSQLNERRAPLFRPNSGQPAGLRQGDSYGPSPVSGGAPSPPLMIEGPRRPPSAPVGRRIDAYGPRPPSDPHGRYPENKPLSAMEMMGPRSSSPANLDGSTQAVEPKIKTETLAEASTESPEPGPGSFLASPIRDSPGPMLQGPPHGPGPHDPLLPPGPQGRLPPPGPYRPPRPSPYHMPPGPPPPHLPPPIHGPPLPANGHPGMHLPGPAGGDFGPRPINGHALNPRPGPGHVVDSRGPPPHFRPPPPHHYGPMPPPHGVRGPIGPRPPVPPDMRFPGPHDYTGLPLDLPPGVPSHPSHPGDSYGDASLNALRNAAGAHSNPRQDVHVKQEAPPQDSARPAMVKP